MPLSPVFIDTFGGTGPLNPRLWTPETDYGAVRCSRVSDQWFASYYMVRCPTAVEAGAFGDFQVCFDFTVRAWLVRPLDAGNRPTEAWDGLHLWARYQNQYDLYTVSFVRRDGQVLVKRKYPNWNAPANHGEYLVLGKDGGTDSKNYAIRPAVLGQRYRGMYRCRQYGTTLRYDVFIDGELLLTARDDGLRAPVAGPGRVGIRVDNAEVCIDNLVVTPLENL